MPVGAKASASASVMSVASRYSTVTPVAAVAVTVIWRTLYWTAARYSWWSAANVGRSVPELMLSALSVASCASTTSGNATCRHHYQEARNSRDRKARAKPSGSANQ